MATLESWGTSDLVNDDASNDDCLGVLLGCNEPWCPVRDDPTGQDYRVRASPLADILGISLDELVIAIKTAQFAEYSPEKAS